MVFLIIDGITVQYLKIMSIEMVKIHNYRSAHPTTFSSSLVMYVQDWACIRLFL